MPHSWNDKLIQIYRNQRCQLMTYAKSITGCGQLAEDSIHDAFIKLLQIKTVPQQPNQYVYRAIRNAGIDQLRKRNNLAMNDPIMNQPDNSFAEDPASIIQQRETNQQLLQAIDRLPMLQREIITLRLRAQLKFREIAQIVEKPLNTVTTNYHRGLARLKSELEAVI